MRSLYWKAALAAVLAATMSLAAKAQNLSGCSDVTLTGDYAFTVSGQIFLPTGLVVQRQGIALTHFDGHGNLMQEDLVLSSPNAPPAPGVGPTNEEGFNINETGTYTVNPDCTGTFTINMPNLTTAAGGSVKGAVIRVHFVLSNFGRSVHTVVTSLTPPGAPGPVPVLISSEGHKVRPIEED